jgi:uncharacterized membrane protein YqjE
MSNESKITKHLNVALYELNQTKILWKSNRSVNETLEVFKRTQKELKIIEELLKRELPND